MRIWLLVFFALLSKGGFAQATVQRDSGVIEVRSFNQNALKEFKKQKTFQYDLVKEPSLSWWDQFWSWFWFKVREILSTNEGKTTMWTFFIIFGIAIIVFFVMKVMGMNRSGLFGRNNNDLPFVTTHEDINQLSFDEAISSAIGEGNYRLATRLLYLQALKKLSDKDYILWQPNKTNTDYLNEVSAKPWHAEFGLLTINFEYTWYGEISINKPMFEKLQNQFQHFNNLL